MSSCISVWTILFIDQADRKLGLRHKNMFNSARKTKAIYLEKNEKPNSSKDKNLRTR